MSDSATEATVHKLIETMFLDRGVASLEENPAAKVERIKQLPESLQPYAFSLSLAWLCMNDSGKCNTTIHFLKGGADPNRTNEGCDAPLAIACTNGNEAVAATLIQFDADLNALTPTHVGTMLENGHEGFLGRLATKWNAEWSSWGHHDTVVEIIKHRAKKVARVWRKTVANPGREQILSSPDVSKELRNLKSMAEPLGFVCEDGEEEEDKEEAKKVRKKPGPKPGSKKKKTSEKEVIEPEVKTKGKTKGKGKNKRKEPEAETEVVAEVGKEEEKKARKPKVPRVVRFSAPKRDADVDSAGTHPDASMAVIQRLLTENTRLVRNSQQDTQTAMRLTHEYAQAALDAQKRTLGAILELVGREVRVRVCVLPAIA